MGIFFQNKEQYSTNVDMARFIDFDEKNSGRPSFITSYFISRIRQIKNYTLTQITSELINSPDYISFKKYRREHMYWWIIMIYNNLLDFSELKFGTQVRVPALIEVNSILADLQLAETSYNTNNVNNLSMVK